VNAIYCRFVKPAADRALAAIGLVALAPLIGILAILIRRRMGSPVIFRQPRIGLGDRTFNFLKFRTMTQDRNADGNLLSDADRLTRFGQFLRAASLDELPQLWNVVKGDMSLIGPRPLLPQYLSRYSQFQRRRHEVKPGITGLAQVKGRNALTWEQKFELDVWYVDHCSLILDLSILWGTAAAVFRRQGISREGHATMPEFMGSEREQPAESRRASGQNVAQTGR
jgi:lipopolysaccharide/colanic/teichoic acid biosynthesis glycosyltransferase